MAQTERREHERIEIRMPTRMWLDETLHGKPLEFEGFATTRDLAIGGTFLEATYLLPEGFPINLEMHIDDGDRLVARGEVVHRIDDANERARGMGIIFTEVDAENRERLLRFFVSERVKDFYSSKFIVEFPHLQRILSLQDVALIINLWEDKEGRLTALKRPDAQRVKSNEAAAVRTAARRGKR